MTKIKVRFKGYNPNSGYGFYQAGDVGTVVGYTQGLAVVIKEDGTFVKAELSHIVKMEEDTTQELEQEEQIKAGNWYVCNCEIMNENMTVAFHRDDVYFCPNDGWLDVNGALLKVGTICKAFRPATKEEIAHIEPIETEPIGVPVEKVKLATKQDT